MKTVFFIAYEFPPLNVGGVQRPLKFTKYLSNFNVKPVVFSLDSGCYPKVFREYDIDINTANDIPQDVDVIRVPSEDILQLKKRPVRNFIESYFSIVPKEAAGWRKNIFSIFEEYLPLYQPDVLIVTAPPFSIACLAVELSKRFKLPLILDMRDAWSGWNMSPYGSYLHYQLTLRAERRCFEAADAIIGTSDQTIENFKRLHPSIAKEKFSLITNGYDKNISDWSMVSPSINKKEFVIGYVGSFYYSPETRQLMFTPWWKKFGHRKLQYVPCKEDWLYRSPYFFFKAIRTLIDDQPKLSSRIKVKFAGNKPEWIDSMVEKFGLSSVVSFVGRISHAESLEFQSSCDALLLTSSKVIGGNDYSIAGKTFEYVMAKKAIVGFVTEGAQKRILAQLGTALICDPDDSNASAHSLSQLISGDWKPKPDVFFLNSLHRKELTKKLSNIIHNVAG